MERNTEPVMFCAVCYGRVHKAHGSWFHEGTPELATIANIVTDTPLSQRRPVNLVAPLPETFMPYQIGRMTIS